MKASIKLHITIILFMVMVSTVVVAQDAYGPAVIVETYPETPAIGAPWILTLLVDYPQPDDITVMAPSFSSPLFLDRFTKIGETRDMRLWTVIEYRFVLNNSDTIELDPFTVISPYGITETSPLTFDVHGSGEEKKMLVPKITWEEAPSQLARGKNAVFWLRINRWNAQQPPPEFFVPEVPHGIILDFLPVSAREREEGMAVKFTLIPLDAERVILPARILHYENTRFEIPALQIRVFDSPAGAEVDRELTVAPDDAPAYFPVFNPAVFEASVTGKAFRGQCEGVYNYARDLWDEGLYSQALAELRRNERDHPAGAFLRPIRREAEENLGLYNTEDENRQRSLVLAVLTFFFFFLVIISPLVCFSLLKGSLRKGAALLSVIVFAAVGSFCLVRLLNARPNGGDDHLGVTCAIPVRRAADTDAECLFYFKEGQPVEILQNSGSWMYVRTRESAGGSGWIPAEAIIFY